MYIIYTIVSFDIDDYNTILSENVDVGNINLEASTPQADKNEGPLTSNIKFSKSHLQQNKHSIAVVTI